MGSVALKPLKHVHVQNIDSRRSLENPNDEKQLPVQFKKRPTDANINLDGKMFANIENQNIQSSSVILNPIHNNSPPMSFNK